MSRDSALERGGRPTAPRRRDTTWASYWDVTVNVRIEQTRAPSAARRPARAAALGSPDRASRLRAEVAEMFGLPEGDRSEVLYENFRVRLAPGQIVAVVGPSGAGKSTLLRAVGDAVADSIHLDLDAVASSDLPTIAFLDEAGPPVRSAWPELEVLSRCGLAEAAVLLAPARGLSAGQQYRLALARAIWRAAAGPTGSGPGRLVLIDDFAGGLDSQTAWVLARQMPKLASRYRLGMIVCTCREELLGPLRPAQTIVKGLGRPASLIQAPPRQVGEPRGATGAPASWPIRRGTLSDYRALGRFHYLAGPPAAHKRIYAIGTFPGQEERSERRPLGAPEIAAVLVVSPPVLNCRGRNVATGGRYVRRDRRPAVGLLNAEIECISRVIVHPIYRGCGLAVRLVRHALTTAEAPLVESLAAMGAVHPFFQIAGMTCYGRFQGATRNYSYYLACSKRATMKRSPAPLDRKHPPRAVGGRPDTAQFH